MGVACPLFQPSDRTVQANSVITLATKIDKECSKVAALTAPPSTSQPNPCEPEVVPKAPKSPPHDWWVGYESESELVSDEESYHSFPPPPPMSSMYDVDPSWTPGGVANDVLLMSFTLFLTIRWCKASCNPSTPTRSTTTYG
ncbi:hypothetical protein HAX54_009067 [Datura stramonium]|uniref:Uncharacterized protein n=1 Tax=Datura stramonium TaxID=4076 RepID=A0ABS8TH53_DATST|nr:hypothetical protein [Datura stramonium]